MRRFELQFHQNQLATPKRSQSTGKLAYSHIAPLGLLSSRECDVLLQNASKERLDASTLLFSSRSDEVSRDNTGLVIVLQGRLDIHLCRECEPLQRAHAVEAERGSRFPPIPHEKSSQSVVIASIGRGQSFGDQTIALGHCSFWSASFGTSLPLSRVGTTIRVLIGEPGTEMLRISRQLYESHLRNDRLRFSYVPLVLQEPPTAFSARVNVKALEDMAVSINLKDEGATLPNRDARQVSLLSRRLMANASLGSFFFQFPPLVIERLCACLSICEFSSDECTRIAQPGDAIQFVLIVIRGHLELHRPQNSATTVPAPGRLAQVGGSPRAVTASDWYGRDRLVPGDAFGASELVRGHSVAIHNVDATVGTLLLCIPQLVFRRWVSSSASEPFFSPGTAFSKLATASSPAKLSRFELRNFSAAAGRASPSKLPLPSSRSADRQSLSDIPVLSDEVSALLYRFGVLDSLPRFLAAQLLPFAVLVSKRAGETLFQEAEEKQALVVVVSGFVSIYSREHMASADEMIRNHPFCRVTAFCCGHTSPDEYAKIASLDDDDGVESNGGAPRNFPAQQSPSKHHHRSATHGLHIQTLAPLSAFRTGVLRDGQVCPGTTVAQTDCECLVFDEGVYSHVLAHHSSAIDLGGTSRASKPTYSADGEETREESAINASTPGESASSSISKCLEESAVSWLRLSAPKKQLAIRSMRPVTLASGQQLVAAGEHMSEVMVVVSGHLSVFVRQSQEVASMLDARQRSIKSLTLEQSVTSNYSTTSQQLYANDDSDASGVAPRPIGQRQGDSFSIRRQLSRITRGALAASSGIFVDSVLAVVQEEKFLRQSVERSESPVSKSEEPISMDLVAPLLHSAVHRANIGRKLSIRREGRRHSRFGGFHDLHHRSLLLCRLGPGDVIGEEVVSPYGGFCQQSKHDVFADAPRISVSNDRTIAPGGVELLCLDRGVYLAILAKTDEEVESELRLRSASVQSKWKRAGKDVASRKRFPGMEPAGAERDSSQATPIATPKLLTLFQNLVNQRYHLTSRAIADIPLLRDLPDASKREICLVAKFETLDRRSGANTLYQLDAGGRGPRSKRPEAPFFIVLSGRVVLTWNSSRSHSVTSGLLAVGSTDNSHWLREVAVGDGFGEFDIFMPGAIPSVHPVAIEPVKMLSIPAPMFIKHWPRALQMKEHIEYLRSGVSLFADLPLDRLACLYQIVEFRSFTHRETVFDLAIATSRESVADSMCLIKSGTCCIRRYLSVPALASAFDADSSSHPPLGSSTLATRGVRAKATIADVSVGHFFWIQADTHPFTLESVSAAVTVAVFPIDRLRMILPPAIFSQLDAQRVEMEALHRRQICLAQQAMTALEKEKGAAAFAVLKVAAMNNVVEDLSARTPIPPKRMLPIPLVSSRPDTEALSEHSPDPSPINSCVKALRSPQSPSIVLNTPDALPPLFDAGTHYSSHLLEHYHIESEVLGLAGSFSIDDSADRLTRLRDFCKQGEVSDAELTPQATRPWPIPSAETSQHERSTRPMHLSFNISIPRVPTSSSTLFMSEMAAEWRTNSSYAASTKPELHVKAPSWRLSGDRSAAKSPVAIQAVLRPHCQNTCQGCSECQDGVLDVDLRQKVATKLSGVSSPLRMIALAPCKPGERFLADPSPEPTAAGQSPWLDSQANRYPESYCSLTPRLKQRDGNHQQRTPTWKIIRAPTRERLCRPELVQKQGFLVVLDETMNSSNAWRQIPGHRRFYVLAGRELREFPDTVVLHNLSQERWRRCYALCSTTSTVVDTRRMNYSMPESVRAQSFVLVVDHHTSIALTAASVMERKQWTKVLTEACCLDSDSTRGSPSPRVEQVQPSLRPESCIPRQRKSRDTAAGSDSSDKDPMPVEYCIS